MRNRKQETFEALLKRSSLGTSDVARAQSQVPPDAAAEILRLADQQGGNSRRRHLKRTGIKNEKATRPALVVRAAGPIAQGLTPAVTTRQAGFMELTDTQLNYFVHNRLKLPQGKRAEYLGQVDNLIERFSAAANGDKVLDIRKFLKTGSLRKGTVLRPKGEFGVDADVAVYLNGKGASSYDLGNLHDRIRRLLTKIYPQKSPSDFTVQPRTLGIEFRTSGLEMDLVPLIGIDGPGDYGWQPSSRGEAPVKTSVTKQLEFIRTRKDGYANFTALVRLLKFWRNFQELDDSFRSFSIELIVSHLQDAHGAPSSIEDGLLRFFLYVAQSELRTPIWFAESGKPSALPANRVVLLDPCNAENNVGRRITDEECTDIVAKCQSAWEAISYARNHGGKTQTLELWKDVFGRSFVIEE